MARKPGIPKLHKHAGSGLAVVRLNGKDYYCGPWGSEQAEARYHRCIAEWLSAGVTLAIDSKIDTVGELVLMFFKHCQTYYVRDGKPTDEVNCQKAALRFAARLYADLPVDAFGPLRLKACRQAMITTGLARKTINSNISRIRRMFQWAAENELINPDVFERLRCVINLRKGRGGKESKIIPPVPWPNVELIRDRVAPQIWAMIHLQWLTGMRSGEVTIMRSMNIDTEGAVWLYKPQRHKSECHGLPRVVAIGPQAQEILRPWLRANLDEFLFQPAEAEIARHKIRKAQRTIIHSPSHYPSRRRKRSPKRLAGPCYTSDSYRRAIARAIKEATRPAEMTDAEFNEWKSPLHWHPHQIRHSFADRAKKEFGLDSARAALGHQDVNTTLIYLERDIAEAVKVARRIG